MFTHRTLLSSTPLILAKAGKSWRWESPGGAASVLPSRALGLGKAGCLRGPRLGGGGWDTLGGAPGSPWGGEAPRALGVLQLDIEPLLLVVPLLERHPVGGVVADGEPVEREDHLLRGLRGGGRGGSHGQHEDESQTDEPCHGT